ncbi:hypothetical protein PHISP_07399 [Aspergillus sp. HF37]|nr:hypothetical protein PHISP_07399 [Aspergillus sp. HF37]
MDSARQGDKALTDSNCPAAIQHFTRALIEHPRAPSYYIKRSTAYTRLKPADGGPDPHSALHDAEVALFLARERGKRELILSAQMRRGVALYQLERFGDAGFVFELIGEKSAGVGPESRTAAIRDSMAQSGGGGGKGGELDRMTVKNGFEQEHPIWIAKVKGKLGKLDKGDERAVVSVLEFPGDTKPPTAGELGEYLEALEAGGKQKVGSVPTAAAARVQEGNEGKKEILVETDLTAQQHDQNKNGAASGSVSSTPAPAPAPAGPSPDKVRHEWYQSHDSVVVTLYVKGVPKDKTDSDLHDHSASLQFPLPSGTLFDFTLDPLYASIDPSSSKVSVMSTKIEIVLRKQVPGQKWSALEASSADVKLADRTTSTASAAPTPPSGPAYPTSSRRGAKDWDKVASDLTKDSKTKTESKKKKSKKEAKEDADAGNESDSAESVDSDYAAGDPVDGFFKKLYANADPDTQRAMVKSYTESQGTSLSTSWGEVGKGKVQVHDSSGD